MPAAPCAERALPGRSRRPQTLREERANAWSHGLGFVAAAAAWPLLADLATAHSGSPAALGIGVLCATMMLVYAASMLYHALPPGRVKDWAHRLDHAAIFVFIAGSYTPFALGPLHHSLGTPLLAAVWALAILGVACKACGRLRDPLASTLLYVAMGWAALAVLDPLAASAGPRVTMLLLAGGAAYTVGALFFFFDHRLPYGHFVWHVFVLAGSSCHAAAAVLPATPG